MNPTSHIPVMLAEAIDLLDVRPGGRYLDGTLGGGGHTVEILKWSSPNGNVLSLDVDPKALGHAREKFSDEKRVNIVEANFRHLADVARREKVVPLDGILLDLGFSSNLLEDPTTGLSFSTQGPLDMRFGSASNDDGLTAAEIVNGWKEREIADLLHTYGEERH
ncbi:MAG: 16S rRNA (cytosine(1402)-N(4))-methyltransferase, partial [Patescibacteria group bacterium]